MNQSDMMLWLPAVVAGGLALLIAGGILWFFQRRWNLLARDRQALLDEIAALEKSNLQLRGKISAAHHTDPAAAQQGEDDAPPEPSAADPHEPLPAAPQATRFPLLAKVDAQHAGLEHVTPQRPTLQQLTEHLRRHAAAHSGIYAPASLYGSFLAAMAVSDILLLRAEGKASPLALPNAAAKALGQQLSMVTAQPAWRSSADLLGRRSEATKLYEETHFLRLLYEASWNRGINFCAVQDFTAAPPEDYLAELLPLIELGGMLPGEHMEGRVRKGLHLAESAWPNDPVRLDEGLLPWPDGFWLLGVCAPGNAQDFPGTISPRLRETVMEFCVPTGTGKPFLVPWTQPQLVEAAHLRGLFAHAADLYKLPPQMRARFDALEEYLAAKMQLSLGTKSAERLERFAAVCLACGMSSREAVDHYLWHHALRRLDSLEPGTLRHLMPGLRDFLGKTFERRSIQMTLRLLDGKR